MTPFLLLLAGWAVLALLIVAWNWAAHRGQE